MVEDTNKSRKWSTQSRKPALWHRHMEFGYDYHMPNRVAGVARGNFLHMEEHSA